MNYLHLMPLLQSPKGRSDGGYAVADFRKVQPELGTMEDLATLKVVDAPEEDSDAWELYHYDRLFVGSDYQGSKRFQAYERFFFFSLV